MAEERGLFDFGGVVEAVTAKMIARHPHVFGGKQTPESAAAQTVAWEEHKRGERAAKPGGMLDDVPRALPALLRARKLQKRAGSVGFDWESAPKVVEKIAEEAGEIVEAQAAGAARTSWRKKSAICCSRWPIWRAISRSIPRRPCAPPMPNSSAASGPSRPDLRRAGRHRPKRRSMRWKRCGRRRRRANSEWPVARAGHAQPIRWSRIAVRASTMSRLIAMTIITLEYVPQPPVPPLFFRQTGC